VFKNFSFVFAVLVIFLFWCGAAPAAKRAPVDPSPILEGAESVFQNMARGDYRALWKGLSARTRSAIVKSVHRALAKEGNRLDEEQIAEDFANGGTIAIEYWQGYLSRFDPKSVLEECRWAMGDVEKDKATIILRHHKSEHDALLQMFFEEGGWKVGLDESFRTRQ